MNKDSEKALQRLENSIENAKTVLLHAEIIVKNIKYGSDLELELDNVMRKAEIPITVWSAYREFHKIYKSQEG